MAASPESPEAFIHSSGHHKRTKTQAMTSYPLSQAAAGPLTMSIKKDNPMSKINQYSQKKMISPSKHIFNQNTRAQNQSILAGFSAQLSLVSSRKKSLAALIGTSATTRNTVINQSEDGMGGATEDFTMLAKRMSCQQNNFLKMSCNPQAYLKSAVAKTKTPGSALKESDNYLK